MNKLAELYAKLPRIDCKRKCQASCGPIGLGHAEYRAMCEYLGYKPGPVRPMPMRAESGQSLGVGLMLGDERPLDTLHKLLDKALETKVMPSTKLINSMVSECRLCPNLNPHNGECMAYAVRPLICRMWGLTKRMKCPYGCVPERWVDDAEFAHILIEVLTVAP